MIRQFQERLLPVRGLKKFKNHWVRVLTEGQRKCHILLSSACIVYSYYENSTLRNIEENNGIPDFEYAKPLVLQGKVHFSKK